MRQLSLRDARDIDITSVNPDDLVDINEIEINPEQSKEMRVKHFMEAVGNPYMFKVGDYVVKIGYSDCIETLNDRMKQYISKTIEIKY